MPGYEKFMKDLVTKKWMVSFEPTDNMHYCSAIPSQSLVQKEEDPGALIIPFTIRPLNFSRALYDLGASINLMPLVVYKQLGLGLPKPTFMRLLMGYCIKKKSIGTLCDVLVKSKDILVVSMLLLSMIDTEEEEKDALIASIKERLGVEALVRVVMNFDSDIIDEISPKICIHTIHLELEYVPSIEHQHHMNSYIQEVEVSNHEINFILAETMNANRIDWSRKIDDALRWSGLFTVVRVFPHGSIQEILDIDIQQDVMGPEMVQGVFSNRGNGHQKMRILDQVLTSKDKDHHSSSPVKENFHDSSQKLEDEYRLIHYKDEMDDSKMDHIGDADDNFNDVFDPGDQEEYAMEFSLYPWVQGTSSLRNLLLKWWKSKTSSSSQKLIMQTLSIIICWNIWKNRYAVKYGGKQPQLARVKFLIYKDISHLLHTAFPYIPWPTGWSNLVTYAEKCRQRTKVTPVYWSKPPCNMVKLNSDSSALYNPGKIGAGGVIRDHNGDLIYAYATPLG
ncbi:putative replication protein B-like [Capsicum annuum]|nr:putative replication protein B-like [Capsicum annuum]